MPVRTTCPYCGVGCGVLATAGAATAGAAVSVAGDPLHPANAGRLCSKGSALADTLGLDGRLLRPRLHGQDTDWDTALDAVADGFRRIIDAHGPDAVAFYVSGQLLTEDYYVANKLMKGYIGSANIDTNSRLCMASAVAAHLRAFGEDVVPVSYEDLESADLIVLAGSNTAWCHPVLYQRIVGAKARRPELKVVVIDPRRTPTAAIADLHVALKAGSDVALFNGLLWYLHQHGAGDREFIEAHTRGVDHALAVAENTAGNVAAVAKHCRVAPDVLEEFYALFAGSPRTVTLFSQGVNQSSAGTDKANSIINCHLLTGRIGRPGAGPFSITGQPNAMGGREVGGLATTLAAHLELGRAEHRALVQGFWGSPTIAAAPGLKAVDLFESIHARRVKAVWIAGTNPVVSLPNANRARAALRRCELVVVSDCVADTDTTALAHVLLPAAAWGEKEGTVTNSERCISRQRAFLPAPGEARADWWMFCRVAERMGFRDGFRFQSPHEIFAEHARLSAAGNDGSRAFDIGALAGLTCADYEALTPVRWPLSGAGGERSEGERVVREPAARPFADGRFYHADGRARFVATVPRAPMYDIDGEYPLVLNTGRIRDQWHTMTRTGRSARLMQHAPEPFVDLHAQDARHAGVRPGELVQVSTRWGSVVARLRCSGDVGRGMIFAPMHWNSQYAGDARVGSLVSPAVDPVSGEPEFKHTPARVAPFVVAWQGFALSRRRVLIRDATAWSLTPGAHCLRYELAGRRVFGNWSPWARRLLEADDPACDWIEYSDRSIGVYRAAHLVEGRLEACVFLSPRPDLPSRTWLTGLFGKPTLDPQDRCGLLAGRPARSNVDTGDIVCACFSVGRNSIRAAVRERKARSAAEIGRQLRAGSNCGSCLSEISGILTAELESGSAGSADVVTCTYGGS
ncbi:MAG TPA: molybdopterin-dependent oxidoreductase [Steroidobacteraceae bacterium]|nr:molybdopterin-dependent oxidoreductase [Steroidobacteraceae bacterium]